VSADGNGAPAELLEALGRLDGLLERAVTGAEAAYGAHGDRFRGLHVDLGEVEQLLRREPAEPILGPPPGEPRERAESLAGLGKEFGLSRFELDVVLVALAPELDLRYERLYAYLQDDVTRKRPTVDLALHLLSSSAAEGLARRAAFQADAPLLRERVVQLVPDPSQPDAPLPRRAIKVDEQIVRLLLGTGGLDSRLEAFCELRRPASGGEPVLATETEAELARAAGGEPLRLYLQGPGGSGRSLAAESLAADREVPLIAADLARMPSGTAPVLAREGRVSGALLYAANVDVLRERDLDEFELLMSELRRRAESFVLAGAAPWRRQAPSSGEEALGVRVISFSPPEPERRRRIWEREVKRAKLRVPAQELDALAGRFTLTPGQIREAAAEAAAMRAGRGRAAREALFAAARAQGGDELATLAVKLQPSFGWDDIVLPDDSVAQLRELCARVVQRERVLADWGFGGRSSLGRGVSALFSGPPGTGKTMAADIVARELRLDLYRVDLAGIVSKWIGETEKNLDRIFRAAQNANVVLLIDEAEALFGKRTEVRDSHDRYANVEISYLLQKMEEYEGVAILATNRITDLDEAFTRRISHVIRFPLPEAAERARIWESVWPRETPRADDLDLALLAREVAFSGAEIKNVALAAAFIAADAGTPVTMEHVLHAVQREYEKAGKSFPESRVAELLEAAA
jgi:adenylate kinase family enzyme